MDNEFQELMVRSAADSRVYGQTFFPERFHRPFDRIHRRIFEAIDNPRKVANDVAEERLRAIYDAAEFGINETCQRYGYTETQLRKYIDLFKTLGPAGVKPDPRLVAIAAPRGIGKTSIANLLTPGKAITFQQARYIVPVSMSADGAIEQGENLKKKLGESPLVQALYGDIKTDSWSKQRWVANILGTNVCVFPRGPGQKIRGMLFEDSRPDLIVVDDLEDPNNMDSEEQRKKKKTWFYADLLNCIDRGYDGWRIVVVGTILHQDSLLQNLLESPNWVTVRLEICDDNFESNAPNFISDEECRELYEKFKADGEVEVFFREYRNLAIPTGSDAAFSKKFFQYYVPNEVDFTLPEYESIVLVDVAKTTNLTSAESAVVGVTVNVHNNTIYVREVQSGRWHPEELYERIIDTIQLLDAKVLGVEVTSLHEFITYPLQNELSRRGVFGVEFLDLHARGGGDEKGKQMRVRSLIPYYRQGMVWHNPHVCGPLEQQLLSYPRPKRWDIMDAFGYITEVLEKGERYMRPSDEEFEEDYDSIEKEFAALGMEGGPLKNFRAV